MLWLEKNTFLTNLLVNIQRIGDLVIRFIVNIPPHDVVPSLLRLG